MRYRGSPFPTTRVDTILQAVKLSEELLKIGREKFEDLKKSERR